ncbi:bifunctional DNA-formamidopyrimidine glycosylase/DNA-(apurinic or apyrimidinic site) lyase [Thermosulfurimonas sp. F29]|uniref:bifunctional DNA-formamidopyrimidine glycosylase/DNA-(apurinic or apyrimidinic site) lyase n=1 Tax=Thermosulfurimonas sp. F29 TaxID=2867247 RepID=UPI001C835556|nr:bifunctional DNA-formamidopyrimidine glycosylase/DNA-(apurinic or apyrimidinic site) lyase [Thermosulfurimonas sp. F29]MBX6424064.1 bifunctional DNA-formamidopyrimidine glycosylase/DNA-(apurinic or apyrimidinic site) lyase [Thermosulfurimonas sp. F29]
MPELPETETIRRDLVAVITGKTIQELRVLVPKLARPGPEIFCLQLKGRKIRGLQRHGKLLLFELGKEVLLVHLGMTGALIFRSSEALPPYTHIVFYLDGGKLFYADPRRFGWLEVLPAEALPRHPFYASLGPDALKVDFLEFEKKISGHKRRIKEVLLDQRVLAGLGNIYTDEALFRAGIHPCRRATGLTPEEKRRLFEAVKTVLHRGIELRGCSIRNYVDGHGNPGHFQNELRVYGRRGEPCFRCGTPLLYTRIAGRGTTFCPSCQR